MGREVKRVAMDFEHPLGVPYTGFLNPFYVHKHDCPNCGMSGYNAETRKIYDDWYDFEQTGRRWCNKLDQEEVNNLVDKGRLIEFTHHFVPGEGWVKNDPLIYPDAWAINLLNSNGPEADRFKKWLGIFMGHDAINRSICIQYRAEKIGVFGYCETCNGHLEVWDSEEAREAAEKWVKEEPPSGEGWQMWEHVSEGSPISPVFGTKEELADWLGESTFFNNNSDRDTWLKFIEVGWCPSMVGSPQRGIQDGVEFFSNT
jgi:hypothetical protein